MDDSTILGTVAIVVSVAAAIFSGWLAVRQALLMRQANHVPALVGLLSEFRSVEFNERFDYVCNRLQIDHDPLGGISGLPREAKEAVYDIGYYFQEFAILSVLDIVDQDVTIALLHRRFSSVWNAISPFVLRERELNSAAGPYVMGLLESFAAKSNDAGRDAATELIRRSSL